jgi:hypothetical protein
MPDDDTQQIAVMYSTLKVFMGSHPMAIGACQWTYVDKLATEWKAYDHQALMDALLDGVPPTPDDIETLTNTIMDFLRIAYDGLADDMTMQDAHRVYADYLAQAYTRLNLTDLDSPPASC